MKKYIRILLLFLMTFAISGVTASENSLIAYADEQKSQPNSEKVVLSPNPALDRTTVQVISKDVQVSQISIYSLLGNQIFSKNYTVKEEQISLNVQSFKKGKYLIKVTFKDGTSEVKALIKQ
ncbi:MAG: T9SS type A sorting domain-containing protein [Weeksellaceae bacterium]